MVPREPGTRVLSGGASASGPGGSAGPQALRGGSRLAVLGRPIAHSRSPRIHAAAYAQLGLPWSYEAIECGEAELAGLLGGLDEGWRGLSLTMPLKEEARRLSTVLDPVADESGVVNTLLRLSGESGWAGFNTDVAGLAGALRNAGLDASRTVVLGAGATAVSAILAARRLGARHIEVVARRIPAISELVGRFGGSRETEESEALHMSGTPLEHLAVTLQEDAAIIDAETPFAWRPTLVISTLPGPATREIELPAALMRVPLFDVAYDPWPSPLAERWRAAGGVAHSGLSMLVEQALAQVRIFVNGDPGIPLADEQAVLAAMRDAGVGG